jgi:hypothetical protein
VIRAYPPPRTGCGSAATVTVEDGTIAWKLKGGQQSGD